jgi:hypothetical protein
MIRRRTALAVLSGCLVPGCGGEGEGEGAEQTERVAQAQEIPVINLVSTGSLPIARVSYSAYGLMTFILARPITPNLFLGSLALQSISGTSIVAGAITPGTSATSPGRANLQVSQDIYDNLLTISTAVGQHGVQLIFEELTLAITAIVVT